MFKKIKKFVYSHAKAVALKFAVPAAAKRIWKRIRDEKDPNTLVFASAFAMGDYLYCMSLLKQIKLAHPDKKIVVVAPERFRDLVESFDSYDQMEYVPNSGGG